VAIELIFTSLLKAGSTGTRPKYAITEIASLAELQLRLFHVTKEKPISGKKPSCLPCVYDVVCSIDMWHLSDDSYINCQIAGGTFRPRKLFLYQPSSQSLRDQG